MNVVLISTYELGRQPFGLASPAAWLRKRGHAVVCLDLARQSLDETAVANAELIALYLPMHTATRLAAQLIPKLRERNPIAHLCCYGLYAPMNAEYLRSLGVSTILGGEFEEMLVRLSDRLARAGLAQKGKQAEPQVSLDRLSFEVPDRVGMPGLEKYAHLVIPGDGYRIVGSTEASRVGAQHISFGDPDLFNGIRHSLELLEAFHREFPEVTYDATIKIEHLRKYEQHLPKLKETGCLFVISAVESVDDAVLEKLDKRHTRENFLHVVRKFREAGLTLHPTFVPFSPWTTMESYLDLLRVLEVEGLVENVAPIQLGIRLLIPEGSRLLELDEVRGLVGPFDAQSLVYPWKNADARLDRLSEAVQAIASEGDRKKESRPEVFERIWKAAHAAAGMEAPGILRSARTGTAVPFLSEPWYCCAEPTKDQFVSIGGVAKPTAKVAVAGDGFV